MKTNTFVRKLASNDRKTRVRAFETLTQYISSRSHTRKLSLLELQKLWKGLYYAMWFSDKALPQKRLATQMSSLFSECVSDEQFALFVTAFWSIMAREWTEIDKWRTDKDSKFDKKLVDAYISALEEGILSGELKLPSYIVMHIVDVWLDELERVIFELDDDEDTPENDDVKDEEEEEKVLQEKKDLVSKIPIDKLLEPFAILLKKTPQKALKNRIRENIFEDQRLKDWGVDTDGYVDKKTTSAEDSKEEINDQDEGQKQADGDADEAWSGFGDN
ncbi:hypothetical protein FOA43_003478 [Brettanomyces nanus]|uniref:Ribosomal RNA-processing protein 1 n=1 Tax=Eeniella nana TaxID=13502 RepID=A0A875S854_EENNA|nr:uncharacterized protein FOA43_003478 [Brettanomyces nanus]QPG76092.1 hypothetical protein FOA43_003478 [Brettanomyces nanus]